MARDGLPWQELTHLVVSHFHADHLGDLVPILWALRHGAEREAEPLHLLAPEGMRDRMEGLARAFGAWVLEPGFPLVIHELLPGASWDDARTGARFRTHPARHTPEALAWRLEARGAGVGYTGDTGPQAALGAFFRGVELLLAECSLPDLPGDAEQMAGEGEAGSEGDSEPQGVRSIHLTPGTLAALAQEAAPALLVTVHHYPELDRSRIPDLLRAAGYSGAVRVAHDGLALAVGPSEVRDLPGSLTHDGSTGTPFRGRSGP
jgi:ribonuclease BN (tRNA processing enzyme)